MTKIGNKTADINATFRRYAAIVLSPFFIFAVFDASMPLTGVINYVFLHFCTIYVVVF